LRQPGEKEKKKNSDENAAHRNESSPVKESAPGVAEEEKVSDKGGKRGLQPPQVRYVRWEGGRNTHRRIGRAEEKKDRGDEETAFLGKN